MKTNISFFNKLTGLALIASAMFWLSSCDEFKDNPTPPTPEPSAVKKTATGAEVAAKSIVGITEALDQVEADIKAKAGKAYVLDVVGTLATSGDDNIITVPKVVGSDVELKFASPITTENALTVKPNETASTTSVESLDKLTITLPAGTEGVKLNLDMPETTVTLKAASGSVVFDEVVATTAINTLYIESGVTVKNIQIMGGTAVIKEGGAAETYVYAPADLETVLANYSRWENDKLVASGLVTPWIESAGKHQITNEDESPYFFSNLKVIKGDAAYARAQTPWDNRFPMEKITIADGAKLVIENFQPIVNTIEGEGNATLSFNSCWSNSDGKAYNDGGLYNVKEIKNLTIEEFLNPDIEGTLTESYLYDVPADIENITFKMGRVTFKNPNAATASVKNCKFEAPGTSKYVFINVPAQTEDITSFKFAFENTSFAQGCKITQNIYTSREKIGEDGKIVYKEVYMWRVYDSEGNWWTNSAEKLEDVPEDVKSEGEMEPWAEGKGYWKSNEPVYEEIPYKDYYIIISFKECKYGDTTMSPDNADFIDNVWTPKGAYLRYEFDGKLYRAVQDPEKDYKYILIPAE